MADGKIRFQISTETKEARKELQQMQKEFLKTGEAVSKLIQKLNALRKNNGGGTKEEAELQKQIAYAVSQRERAYQNLIEAQQAVNKSEKVDKVNTALSVTNRLLKNSALLGLRFAKAMTVDKITRGFAGLTKGVRNFGRRLKYVILQGLLFRNLRKYLSEFASAIGSAFKQNEQFNASLANLKGTFWASIAPVIDALAPIIARFLDMIAKLITYLSGLIGILFKIGKASKTAGAGLASAGKSGKEASNNLAAWDTIQNLDSGSGGSADSGISPTFGQDFEEAYTALDKFRELIEKGDWFEIGKYVGEKLNELITTIDNWVTGTLAPKIKKWVTNAAQFLNGFLTGVNWKNVGKTLSDIIITLFNGISTWLSEVDWELVGRSVRDFLLGIDWGGILKSVGEAIGLAIVGGIEFIEGLTGLDLSWLIDGFNDLIKVITTLGDVLSGETTLKEWWDNLSDGQAIIAVILGIAGAIAAVVSILSTVVSTIKTVSGLMTILAQGHIGLIILAISALIAIIVLCIKHWDEIKEVAIKVWEAIKNAVNGAITAIRDWFVKAYNDISAFLQRIVTWIDSEILLPIINFFINAFNSIVNWFIKAYNNISAFLQRIVTWIDKVILLPIVNFFVSAFNKIMNTTYNIVNNIKAKWVEFKVAVSSVFDSIGKKASSLWKGLKNGFRNTINGIIRIINGLIGGIESAINWIVSGLNKISFKLPDWIPKIGGRNFGFSLNTVSIGRISELPALAQGSVVNPGHEFAAILGDNRKEQEIVSPLSTMKQALLDALSEYSGNTEVVLEVDGRKFATAMIPHINNRTRAYGTSVVL